MYDPTIGRFLQRDSPGVASSDPNLYRYVGNSPTNFDDPTGRQKLVFDANGLFLGTADKIDVKRLNRKPWSQGAREIDPCKQLVFDASGRFLGTSDQVDVNQLNRRPWSQGARAVDPSKGLVFDANGLFLGTADHVDVAQLNRGKTSQGARLIHPCKKDVPSCPYDSSSLGAEALTTFDSVIGSGSSNIPGALSPEEHENLLKKLAEIVNRQEKLLDELEERRKREEKK
jgi:hypothetical protein